MSVPSMLVDDFNDSPFALTQPIVASPGTRDCVTRTFIAFSDVPSSSVTASAFSATILIVAVLPNSGM